MSCGHTLGEQLGGLDRQRSQALEAAQLVKYFLEFQEGQLSSVFTDPTKIHQVHTPSDAQRAPNLPVVGTNSTFSESDVYANRPLFSPSGSRRLL